MLTFSIICQAQKISIKPYFIYHQSVLSQKEPVFHKVRLDYPYHAATIISGSSFNDDFSLATGLEYGITADYTFRNNLGIGLMLGYFSGINNSFEGKSDVTTDWDYHSIAIRPLFSYSVVNGKSVFIGKAGPTFHYTSASVNVFSGNSEISVCTFDNRLSWGYLIGLEYNYRLSEQFSLAAESGIEQYKYTPARATIEYGELSSGPDEMAYVKEIVGEPYYHPGPPYYWIQNKMLKKSVLISSIYFGIGVKYNLWKK